MSEKEINRIIANNINLFLSQHGKSQVDLAAYMGVSQATVSNWCKGLKMPRMDKIDNICHYFNINRSDLMMEKNAGEPRHTLSLSPLEEEIVVSYRQADDISKAMVRRALSIEEPATVTEEAKLA